MSVLGFKRNDFLKINDNMVSYKNNLQISLMGSLEKAEGGPLQGVGLLAPLPLPQMVEGVSQGSGRPVGPKLFSPANSSSSTQSLVSSSFFISSPSSLPTNSQGDSFISPRSRPKKIQNGNYTHSVKRRKLYTDFSSFPSGSSPSSVLPHTPSSVLPHTPSSVLPRTPRSLFLNSPNLSSSSSSPSCSSLFISTPTSSPSPSSSNHSSSSHSPSLSGVTSPTNTPFPSSIFPNTNLLELFNAEGALLKGDQNSSDEDLDLKPLSEDMAIKNKEKAKKLERYVASYSIVQNDLAREECEVPALRTKLSVGDDIDECYNSDPSVFKLVVDKLKEYLMETRKQLFDYLNKKSGKQKLMYVHLVEDNKLFFAPAADVKELVENASVIRKTFTHGQLANFMPTFSAGHMYIETSSTAEFQLCAADGASGHYLPEGYSPILYSIYVAQQQFNMIIQENCEITYYRHPIDLKKLKNTKSKTKEGARTIIRTDMVVYKRHHSDSEEVSLNGVKFNLIKSTEAI